MEVHPLSPPGVSGICRMAAACVFLASISRVLAKVVDAEGVPRGRAALTVACCSSDAGQPSADTVQACLEGPANREVLLGP